MAMRLRHTVHAWRERRASQRANAPKRVQAGFTLVEMLAAMAVLLLASAIVAAGVPAATQAYIAAVDNANAQVLLSTTTTRLRDELSVADTSPASLVEKNEVVDSSAGEKLFVTFNSVETGYVTSVKYSDDMGLYLEQTNATGVTTQTPLVPVSAAAGANASLHTSAEEITWNKDEGVFTVRGLKVLRADGTELKRAGVDEFDVRVLAPAS